MDPTATPTLDPTGVGARTDGIGTVGVLICTYATVRIPMLRECLASLRDQTRTPDEVLILVDGTEAIAGEIRAALGEAIGGLHVECLGSNQGVSRARNAGAALLATDWMVILDDDAHVEPAWLERLTSPLGEPGVLGAAGLALPDYDRPRPAWLPGEFLWAFGCSYDGLPTTTSRTRNFFGFAAVVHRATFLEVGGFSPEVGHHGRITGGGEEALFCLQATRLTGGWFVYEPSAVAHHHLTADRMTWGYYLRRCFGEGVNKQHLASIEEGSIGDERSFALGLPPRMVRYVLRGQPLRAVGVAAGALAVVVGLLYGRVTGGRARRRARAAVESVEPLDAVGGTPPPAGGTGA